MRKLQVNSLLLSALFLISTAAFSADANVLAEAKALIKAGDFKAAYALLEPLETENAGSVEYDMLFGVAAVEGGETSRGIFALERVLDTQPLNIEARVILAKGYFKSGEDENAKKEFNNVLGQKPDAELTSIIEKNIISIDKATGQATMFAAFVDLGIGHDSNINSATTASSVSVALNNNPLVPFRLTNASQKQSSNYLNANAGLSVRTPITKNLSAFGSLAGYYKDNYRNGDFDIGTVDYSAGLNLKHNIDTYTIALQGGSFAIDNNNFRDAIGVNAQWQRNLNNQNQISVYGLMADYEYAGENDIRDARRYVVGSAWSHSFEGDKAKVSYLSAYAGQESTDRSVFDFLSYDLYGLRAGGQMAINYKLVAFAGLNYEFRDYDKTDPTFQIAREDHQYDFNVGLKYLPGYNITIKPQLSYIDNRSNNDLFEFERFILSLNVRKDFSW